MPGFFGVPWEQMSWNGVWIFWEASKLGFACSVGSCGLLRGFLRRSCCWRYRDVDCSSAVCLLQGSSSSGCHFKHGGVGASAPLGGDSASLGLQLGFFNLQLGSTAATWISAKCLGSGGFGGE